MYNKLVEQHGYLYYMVSGLMYKKTNNPIINEYYWEVSDCDSFYKLLDKDSNLFYYTVFLDPKDNELHVDSYGRIFAESIFIEEGPYLLSDHPNWTSAAFCREALERSSCYVRFIKSKDVALLNYIKMVNPTLVLGLDDLNKCYVKWKIDTVIENPYLFNDPKIDSIIGYPALNKAIVYHLTPDYWKYIKNPGYDLLKSMLSIDTISVLQTQNISNSEIISQYLKNNPELIFQINNPTTGMYYISASSNPLLITQFPIHIILRIIGKLLCSSSCSYV